MMLAGPQNGFLTKLTIPAQIGTFIPVGTLNTARSSHTATLLRNGKVLIVGGIDT